MSIIWLKKYVKTYLFFEKCKKLVKKLFCKSNKNFLNLSQKEKKKFRVLHFVNNY